MLDHIEVIFDDMKPMMKKLKKKNYKENMDGFLNRYGHYFHEMTALTAGAEDKGGKAEKIASVFVDSVEKKFASPKKGRVDGVIQLDLNFFMIYYVFPAILLTEHGVIQLDLNFFMIYYVFPAILLTEHEDARLIADRIRDEWSGRFKDSDIQYSDYDTIYAAFREKIFGIL